MKWILGSVFKYYYDIRKDLSALHTFWNIINMKEVFVLHKIYLCYQSKKNLSYKMFMSCNLYNIKSITKCSKHQLEYYPEELFALHNSHKYFQQKIYQFFIRLWKKKCALYILHQRRTGSSTYQSMVYIHAEELFCTISIQELTVENNVYNKW